MNRKKIYDSLAEEFLSRYNVIRISGIDTGMSGNAAERLMLDWISEWMPRRISPTPGALISKDDGPTNQMDCILFDSTDCPSFGRDLKILPIEGVVGAVELNFGLSTSYGKIEHDCEKLILMNQMASQRISRVPQYVAQFPKDTNVYQLSDSDVNKNVVQQMGFYGKLQSIIYAEDINGSLEEAASRICTLNERVGFEASVDGLFVLKKGFALHIDPNNTGWTVHRVPGSSFGCINAPEGQTILRFQSIILKYLHLMGKAYAEGFDQYFSETGQIEKEMKEMTLLSGEFYPKQLRVR